MSDFTQRIARPSPEARAVLERRLREKNAPAAEEPIPRRGGDTSASLSFAQQRLWVLDRLNPGLPFHSIPRAFRLRGLLDVEALGRALDTIRQRHEVLRSVFLLVDGGPVQSAVRPQTPSLSMVDLGAFAEGAREAEARRLAEEQARMPFDLERGPLLRTTLLRLAEQEHVLLVNVHHIAFDGWSADIFDHELTALYEAYHEGRPSSLPALPIQYADFAVWQREWLQGKVLEEQLSYWKRQLEGAPAVLDLPTSRPRPLVQTFRGATETVSIPGELAEAIRRLGQREGATLFMTLLAAFQVLLLRHSGQEDIVVGSPVAGRSRSDIEGLIGFFANTLVLRTDLSGDPTFRELLGRVREVALGAYAHQDLPFEKLVEVLQPKRDFSRTPVFQVFFQMLDHDAAELRLAGVEIGPIGIQRSPRFDLTLYASEVEDGIRLSAVYNPDLFEGARILEMQDQLARLLEQIAVAPNERIGSYSLLTPSARNLLPDPTVPIQEPEMGIVANDFLSWVDRAASAPAVVQEGHVWTYGDLAQRSRTIAESLIVRGLAPGDVVGVEGRRSFGLIASMLGVLRSGGVLLTLDRALPAERVKLMLSEARARWVVRVGPVTQEDSGPSRPGSLPVIPVDEDGLAPGERLAPGVPLPRVSSNDPVSVFFTSGTSGVPKAVLGSQKGLSHFLRWQRETFEVGPGDRCSQLTGLSFIVFLRDVFLPLTSGASLHLPDRDEEAGSGRIVSWLEREGITIAHIVPSVAQSWLAVPPAGARLTHLRLVVFGGEPLTEALVRRWRSAFPDSGRIVNLYGATESSMAKCFFVVPEDPPAGIQPVGRPLPATQALILREGLRLCGIGELGEIVLRTPFRSLGYLNAPGEQQDRFIQNPFRVDEDDVLYRTGDRGRYRLDGSLEVLGRWDDQVKIRGVRVEPDEVAVVLSGHRLVETCAVVARTDDQGETALVAYVVSPHQGPAAAAELRSYLAGRFPAAMVPSAFVFLAELPLTPNGKLNRAALPPPGLGAEERAERLELPRMPVEEIVATIWAAILGIERIGIQEDFFELGGHSLKATRVMSRVNQAFRLDLLVRALFENPTLASLSSVIERALLDELEGEARGDVRADALAVSARREERLAERLDERRSRLTAAGAAILENRIRDAGRLSPSPDRVSRRPDSSVPAFLSFAQQRLWVLDRLDPGLASYNIPRAFRIRGPLDVEALGRALGTMEERHEVLRSVCRLVDGNPVQVVGESRTQPLSVVDLAGLAEGVPDAEMRRVAGEEARRPFDLARGPLLRTKLLRVAEQDHVLVVTIHHVVFDGWSGEIFDRELAALYEAYREGRPSPLPALPIQYADFAAWQREWLEGEVLEEQIAYWKRQLQGAPAVLELPESRLRPSSQSFRGATETVSIPLEVGQAIRRLGQREGATLFMTLLAAFKVLLLRHSGQEDLVLGTVVAGRTRSDIEELIGFFVNTLVLRTDLSGDPTFRELLGRVREVALEAYAHQDLPFEKLVEELNPERTLSHSPLFQVMMVLQNAPAAGLRLAGAAVTPLPLETETSMFDLTASFVERGEEIWASFEYNTDLFDASTVRRMLSHLEVLLGGIAQDPDRRLSQLPLLTASERHQVLVDWNQTQKEYPKDKTVHRLFEEQVERAPEAVAVEFEGKRLTYGELNRRSNQLARHLQGLGVGPEVLVGLCVERSLEMVVALLGILKAGGAYLPLDPAYPRERLRFMLEDSGAHALLTHQAAAGSCPPLPARTTLLDASWETIARERGENLESGVALRNLAYVIYTSGSTGKPKGVEIEHGSFTNLIRCAADRFGVRPGERVLQFASLSFDPSAQQIFSALSGGATLVLRSEEMISTVATFLARCREWRLTILDLPTSYWHELVAVASAERLSLPASLRVVCIGGESALPERFAQWREMAGDRVQLLNEYGPTEATVAATFWEASVGLAESISRTMPIGRPIANVQTYVLDASLQPVPVGVPGELYIGGAGLARGYRNRPDLTAEKFIPDPFRGGKERLYRTGDRVRFQPGGDLEYLGRVDGQVKVRGFRVELGEVEAVLRGISGVREAVVRAHEDLPGQTRFIAYLVPDGARCPSVRSLRRLLEETLPAHMVPSTFLLLDALPRTPNGKLDAAALPMPESSRPELDESYQGPRTPAEEVLAEIWMNVLRVDRVGVHDNFFELGGHSLLATRVISRARDAFHVELPLRDLFLNPTVAGLAMAIAEKQAERVAPAELERLLSELETPTGEAGPKWS
jgi:amino acid adenylation domain-containing protein